MFVHTPLVSVFSAPPSPPPVFPSLFSLFSQPPFVRPPLPTYFNHYPMAPQTDNFTFSQNSSSSSRLEMTTPSGDTLKREVVNGGEPRWTKNNHPITHAGEIARLENLHQNTIARQAMNFSLISQHAVDRAANTINRTMSRAANIINGALQRLEYLPPPRKVVSGPFWRVMVF